MKYKTNFFNEDIPYEYQGKKFPSIPSEERHNAIYSSDLNPYTGLSSKHPLYKSPGLSNKQKQILDYSKSKLSLKKGGKIKYYDQGGYMDFSGVDQSAGAPTLIDKLKLKSGTGGNVMKTVGVAETALDFADDLFGKGSAEGNTDKGGSALSGAIKGAAAGTSILPGWGTAIGAVVGGFSGLVSAGKNQQALDDKIATESHTSSVDATSQLLKDDSSNTKGAEYIKSLIKEQMNENTPPGQSVNQGEATVIAKHGMKLHDGHVSDDSYNRYVQSLKAEENPNNKGFDKASGLWFPFDVSSTERNIGWGLNLANYSDEEIARFEKGLTTEEVEKMFKGTIDKHMNKSMDWINEWQGSNIYGDNTGYRGKQGNWKKLPDHVKTALTDYHYNLGSLKKFPKFVTAVMNNDLVTAKKEYERSATIDGKKTKLTKRNKYIYDLLFTNPASETEIYNKGGMTKGAYNHKTNPLTVVDKNGQSTGMELTGGEGVYDADAQNKIETALKKKDYKKVGKIIEYEINDWKKRGMYS